jgi:hypothetical protein
VIQRIESPTYRFVCTICGTRGSIRENSLDAEEGLAFHKAGLCPGPPKVPGTAPIYVLPDIPPPIRAITEPIDVQSALDLIREEDHDV